jgi:hypothetical protein
MNTEQPQTIQIPHPNPTISNADKQEIRRNGRLFQNGLCYMKDGTVYGVDPKGWRRLTKKRHDVD